LEVSEIKAMSRKFIDDSEVSAFLNQSLDIGKKSIHRRLTLAPMAKLGNLAFRELISGYGGYGLLFTEMCGAKSVIHGDPGKHFAFKWKQEELPELVCQIFGNDPEIMAKAAVRIEKEGFFGVDINFGCCGSSIRKQNFGAYLLKNPPLAGKIVAEVRKRISCPLFIKFRTGWEDNPGPAVEFAKRFEDAGADALTFHPRVAPDRRTRKPKWGYIGLVKESVSIPVFGNGNVFDFKDCKEMLEKTGCDGIALGRLAVAKPWIFAEWSDNFNTDIDVYRECALKFTDSLLKHFEPSVAVRRFSRFAPYFSGNFRFGHAFYSSIRGAETMETTRRILQNFFETQPELVSRPNMNMFL